MDEKQAIARLKQGDLGGLETLVDLFQLQAVRTAVLITGDEPLAKDIVQNAFIRVGERIHQFDAERPFWPWFLRSVVHDAIKASSRQRRWISLDTDEGDEVITLIDSTPLPEELVEKAEAARIIQQALEQLPSKQRAAIVLRYYLEMSEAEIAEALHGPTGTVKWWLHVARLKLAGLLHPFYQINKQSTENRLPCTKSDLESGDQK